MQYDHELSSPKKDLLPNRAAELSVRHVHMRRLNPGRSLHDN
jgi:hypothetical protein